MRNSLMEDLRVQTCSRGDVDMLLGWARDEGWNPGKHDALPFHVADPHGFFIGPLGEQAVAGISAIRYGPSFAFVGLYIVRPEFRGKGYGAQVWRHAMACAEGRTIGLDGVVAQQANYVKSGFVLAYRHV